MARRATARGISFYRLRQTDYDGKYEVFDPVSVKRGEASESSASSAGTAPNPFSEQFQGGHLPAAVGRCGVRPERRERQQCVQQPTARHQRGECTAGRAAESPASRLLPAADLRERRAETECQTAEAVILRSTQPTG